MRELNVETKYLGTLLKKEVEPNYHNQQYFDAIDNLYNNVDFESLALPKNKKGKQRSWIWNFSNPTIQENYT